MKDRIRQLMESQQMNQQSFANFIGVSPASLSSILQERTRPTLNIVEAIRSKMPNLNTDWLMWGEGEMFQPGSTDAVKEPGSLLAMTLWQEQTQRHWTLGAASRRHALRQERMLRSTPPGSSIKVLRH